MESMTPAPASGLAISLDEDKHLAWVAEIGKGIALAPNEFKLVQVLHNLDGQVASREDLLAAIWGDGYDLDSLYRLVQRVKEKIEPDPANPRYLISHRGLGYSLDVGQPLRVSGSVAGEGNP
jgi:DNA-binding response OmpR family regulator